MSVILYDTFLNGVFDFQDLLTFFIKHHSFLKSNALKIGVNFRNRREVSDLLVIFNKFILQNKFLSIKIHIEKCKKDRNYPPAPSPVGHPQSKISAYSPGFFPSPGTYPIPKLYPTTPRSIGCNVGFYVFD